MGALFLIDALALLLASVWLAGRGSAGSWLTSGSIAALTMAAYLGSRTLGLPQMGREAWDAVGLATTAAEAAVAAATLHRVRHEKWPLSSRGWRARM